MTKKVIQKAARFHNKEERRAIIEEYLSSDCTKQEIWKKYTGEEVEHGYLLKWMRQLGFEESKKVSNIVVKKEEMLNSDKELDNFEKLQLEKRIEELEKQLKEAEIKAIAFSTMVDIAEKELKIPIRKKLNTKPLKK